MNISNISKQLYSYYNFYINVPHKKSQTAQNLQITKNKNNTKINSNSFFFHNSNKIIQKLNKISNSTDYFYFYYDYKPLKMEFENSEDTLETRKYLLFYKNIQLTPFKKQYYNELTNNNSFKNVIHFLLNNYKKILKVLNILYKNDIIHNNLTMETMLFDSNQNIKLQDFKYSILYNSINEDSSFEELSVFEFKIKNKDQIYIDDDWRNSMIPFEKYVLYYLYTNTYSLSTSVLDNLFDTFLKKNKVFLMLPKSTIENYKSECIKYYSVFNNKPKEEVIQHISQYSNTWDNYHLSIIYIFFILKLNDFFHDDDKKNNFMLELLKLLLMNVQPNVSKRKNPKETIELFQNICNSNAIIDLKNIINIYCKKNFDYSTFLN
jgi:hypothetical protein